METTKTKIQGAVELQAGGETYTILFDWDALAILQEEYSNEDLIKVAGGKGNFDMLADILAVGLQRHHKGITAEDIKKLSPPFITAVKALDRALGLAWHGGSIDDDDFGEDAEPEKKSKRPTNRKARRAKTPTKKKT